MKIILDAMSGDNAPKAQIIGGLTAAEKLGVDIILCGNKDIIEKEMASYKGDTSRVTIHHCTEVIENEDDPIRSVRRKPDSSITVGLGLLNEGKADAFISSGNTGAVIVGSMQILGVIEGISRPALMPVIPTAKGPCALLDSGANAVCTPENLCHFAIMGSYYMNKVMGIPNPRVGLINIGVEEKKGTPLTKEAYKMLKEMPINFTGNIEARHIPAGNADVIIADGFTGNIVLKLYEGMGKFLLTKFKDILMTNIKTKIAALLIKGEVGAFKKSMDYKEHGGAPLLGVNKTVIKAHGSSDAKAVVSAVRQAMKAVESNLTEEIKNCVKPSGV